MADLNMYFFILFYFIFFGKRDDLNFSGEAERSGSSSVETSGSNPSYRSIFHFLICSATTSPEMPSSKFTIIVNSKEINNSG